MKNRAFRAALRALSLVAVVLFALAGCWQSHALLIEGDANSARISFGGDMAGAAAVAKRHCARFDRVARFKMADMDIAYFDCVRR